MLPFQFIYLRRYNDKKVSKIFLNDDNLLMKTILFIFPLQTNAKNRKPGAVAAVQGAVFYN